MNNARLVKMALEARQNSYSPYSGYKVGAALLCPDGRVFAGCNVENASYPVCCCAERSALFAAVSAGYRDFEAMAVVGGKEDPPILSYAMPCGMCRQALAEFGEDIRIITARGEDDYIEYLLKGLLPGAFVLPEKDGR